MDRRRFMISIGAAPLMSASIAAQSRPAATDDRAVWVGHMQKLADPVLNNLSAETLKARMPVEQAAGATRESVTHLEALGRLIAQIAERSQVLVVSHAPALVDALQQLPECHSITLEKHFGETRVAGDDAERPLWQWPTR